LNAVALYNQLAEQTRHEVRHATFDYRGYMEGRLNVSSDERSLFKGALERLFAAFVNLYAVGILVYIGARLLDMTVVAELGSNFMPPALLVALPLLMISLLLRRRVQAVVLLPIVVYFAVQYGAMFLPEVATAAPDAPRLRLLTYNLHGATTNFEPIIAIIRAADADIVTLQELTTPGEQRFAAEFADEYPYQLTFAIGASVVGQGILSRYPLSEGEYWEAWLGNIRTLVSWEGTTITLYDVHPPPPSLRSGLNAAGRRSAIDGLLERLSAENGRVIIAGDFNMTDETGDYARLTQSAALWDAFREAGTGLGPTFPNLGYGTSFLRYLPPLFRIDYVFYTQPFRAVEAHVWDDSGGSDHYPVLVTLAME
jgi:endonuclease/exonuclease/phosphatase (EEP) superfamily protein YafD